MPADRPPVPRPGKADRHADGSSTGPRPTRCGCSVAAPASPPSPILDARARHGRDDDDLHAGELGVAAAGAGRHRSRERLGVLGRPSTATGIVQPGPAVLSEPGGRQRAAEDRCRSAPTSAAGGPVAGGGQAARNIAMQCVTAVVLRRARRAHADRASLHRRGRHAAVAVPRRRDQRSPVAVDVPARPGRPRADRSTSPACASRSSAWRRRGFTAPSGCRTTDLWLPGATQAIIRHMPTLRYDARDSRRLLRAGGASQARRDLAAGAGGARVAARVAARRSTRRTTRSSARPAFTSWVPSDRRRSGAHA